MRKLWITLVPRFLLCVFVIAITTNTCQLSAQETDAATLTNQVDSLFAKWDNLESPGCVLGVMQNGKFIYKRSYGMSSLDDSIPMSTTTMIYVASIVKQFIAASVLLAADQGHFALDDDIRKYVPELPDYGTPITIQQLVHHTSGIRDFYSLAWLPMMQWPDDAPTDEEALSILKQQKELNFTPGTEFDYTTSNYVLLELIIKRATGIPLWEFADANIFEPLGMENTLIHHDKHHGAIGYTRDKENKFESAGMSNRQGMYTTLEDFLLWVRNFSENKLGRDDFASRLETSGVLQSGEEVNYAFGLTIGEYKGLRTVAHDGAFSGFSSAVLSFPDQQFSVVCFCNVRFRSQSLVSQVANLYLENQFKISDADSIELSTEYLQELAGTYLSPTGRVMTLELKDSIFGFVGRRGTNQLVPLSKTRFRATKFGNNEAQFYCMGTDSAWHFDIIVSIAGMRPTRTLTFKAVQLISPEPSQLEEYVGKYRSDEVQADYEVILEEGKLVLAVGMNTNRFQLKPTVKNGFSVERKSSTIDFKRNDQGRVTEFRLQVSGIWSLLFVKED